MLSSLKTGKPVSKSVLPCRAESLLPPAIDISTSFSLLTFLLRTTASLEAAVF